MKVLDPLTDVNVVVDNIDAAISGSADLYQGLLYDDKALLFFVSGSTSPSFSVEYGEAVGATYVSTTELTTKQSIYKKYARLLLDNQDSKFTYIDSEGLSLANTVTLTNAFFFDINRIIKQDEIRKQGFEMEFYWTTDGMSSEAVVVKDETVGSTATFKRQLNSDFDTLYFSGSTLGDNNACGLIFYQPGILVLDGSKLFALSSGVYASGSQWISGSTYVGDWPDIISATSGSLTNLLGGFWNRWAVSGLGGTTFDFVSRENVFYQDFYCRAHATEFNYSSNPSYVDSSYNIRIADQLSSQGVHSYVTTVGLYDSNRNLLAVAKLSEPIRKDVATEKLFRVRVAQ